MTGWPTLRRLLDDGDLGGVAKVCRELGPRERQALVAPLKVYERQLRSPQWSILGSGPWEPPARAVAIACAAVLPLPGLPAWLMRSALTWRYGDQAEELVGHLVDVLLARDVDWLPDLARRLADRLPVQYRRGRMDEPEAIWRLITELTRRIGSELPLTDGYVFIAAALPPLWGPALRLDAYGPDQRFLALVPRLFEVDGVDLGRDMDEALAALAAPGLVDRSVLLDGCLARLRTSRTVPQSAGFLRLVERLRPTLDEIEARQQELAALVPGAHSTVVAMAQKALRSLGKAGRPSPVLDVSRAMFFRKEKKLVLGQLAWLREALAAGGLDVDAALGAVVGAFGHPADVQQVALDLVLAHLDRAGPAVRAELAGAAHRLPADLRQRVGELSTAVSAPKAPAPWQFRRRRMPLPITSVGELVEQAEPMLRRPGFNREPIALERILGALVGLAHDDRDALSAALRRVVGEGHEFPHTWGSPPSAELVAIVEAVLNPVAADDPELPDPSFYVYAPTPTMWFAHRLHEIARGLRSVPPPSLLSTPTESSGLIDPDELLGRLEQAEAGGWEPWPYDFAQAMLRLPLEISQQAIDRTGRLTSPAGVMLLAWLKKPAVAPTVRVLPVWDHLMHDVLHDPEPSRLDPDFDDFRHKHWPASWAAMLPTRRNRIAEHLLTHRYLDGWVLKRLAEAHGPVGPAMNRLLGYGLGEKRPQAQAGAVEAVQILAARDGFDGATLGEAVGTLVSEGRIPLQRTVPALREVAKLVPAPAAWDVIRAAVVQLLPAPGQRATPRLADLLSLAVDVAPADSRRIPELERVAQQGGSSRYVREAARLLAVTKT